MAARTILGLLAGAVVTSALPAADPAPPAPSVTLDYGPFAGKVDPYGTESFLGIPYAAPPSGTNRLKLPGPPVSSDQVRQATAYGAACPQQQFHGGSLIGLTPEVTRVIQQLGIINGSPTQSEDCLTINVVRPAGTTPDDALPVAFWIFGGGFELGAANTYNGSAVVSRSVHSGQPIIYVSFNYRLNAFGFLGGKEVKAAGIGNLGLQDQRFALQWVNKYIKLFGGDPTQVTLWGESAGAISASLHMLANGGDPGGLFRGAIMNSGSPIPVGDIVNGQATYDGVVADAGCANATDTLECLREAPFATFQKAASNQPLFLNYQTLHLAYLPRADGVFLTDLPQQLVKNGKYAKGIPIINGDCDDEGTLFTLPLGNITTEDQAIAYLQANYAPSVSMDQVQQLSAVYPADPAQGSPFDTGSANALTSQFKRLAAFQGDLVFQAPRRFFLSSTSQTQPTWSYINKRMKTLANVGSMHATDLLQYFYAGNNNTQSQALDYVINFVNNLDPNKGANPSNLIYWPKYDTANFTMLQYDDVSPNGLTLNDDTYRQDAINALIQLSLQYPI